MSSGVLAGILAISPEKIQAVDMDSINSPISYSFLSGVPSSFREFFEINPSTGAVRQIKPVDTSVAKKFEIIVKVKLIFIWLLKVQSWPQIGPDIKKIFWIVLFKLT